jgi:hypothetical protein
MIVVGAARTDAEAQKHENDREENPKYRYPTARVGVPVSRCENNQGWSDQASRGPSVCKPLCSRKS